MRNEAGGANQSEKMDQRELSQRSLRASPSDKSPEPRSVKRMHRRAPRPRAGCGVEGGRPPHWKDCSQEPAYAAESQQGLIFLCERHRSGVDGSQLIGPKERVELARRLRKRPA
jgi:hypothetical protein